MKDKRKISIIVPAYNEEDNISLLVEKTREMIDESGLDCELVIVDDGSTDSTYERIVECEKKHDFVESVRHRRNFGKTRALLNGLERSRGEILVLLDADLQYQPKDIPKLVHEISKGFDVVAGWKSGKYQKQLVSSIYNRLSRWLFDIPVHDQNAVKAFKREILEELPLRKDWHRYIIALARDRGYRISEVRVELHPRRFGTSKYGGSWRIAIGVLDMIAVKFQLSFMRKPMLLFGTVGGIFLTVGVVAGIVALYLRFGLGRGLSYLLYLVVLLILAGLSLFALGFLAEAIAHVSERIARLEEKLFRKE